LGLLHWFRFTDIGLGLLHWFGFTEIGLGLPTLVWVYRHWFGFIALVWAYYICLGLPTLIWIYYIGLGLLHWFGFTTLIWVYRHWFGFTCTLGWVLNHGQQIFLSMHQIIEVKKGFGSLARLHTLPVSALVLLYKSTHHTATQLQSRSRTCRGYK
jgi:hypothetical protein